MDNCTLNIEICTRTKADALAYLGEIACLIRNGYSAHRHEDGDGAYDFKLEE